MPMTAESLLEGVAAMVAQGLSSDDVVQTLLKTRGGTDDPQAEGAADRHRQAQAADVAMKARFPNSSRLVR